LHFASSSGAAPARLLSGTAVQGDGIKDIRWLDTNGHEMTVEVCRRGFARAIGAELRGDVI